MDVSESCWCVVVAAGRGLRFGGEVPKQYVPIDGRPLLAWTLARLAAHPRIAGLVVVLAEGDAYWPTLDKPVGTPLRVAAGGATRADSVLAGLDALPDAVAPEDFVLVHDAARPCVRAEDIDRLITLGVPAGGGLLAAPLRDTLKRADATQCVEMTEPREARWRALTPQLFRRGALAAALGSARMQGVEVTDEAMAMERCGARPLLVEGADDNIKVTTPADRALAEFLLRRLAADAAAS